MSCDSAKKNCTQLYNNISFTKLLLKGTTVSLKKQQLRRSKKGASQKVAHFESCVRVAIWQLLSKCTRLAVVGNIFIKSSWHHLNDMLAG